MRSTILSMLQRSDKHLSGEMISEKLGITRSAVWKHIKSLKNEGYEIDSVRNRGYKLISAPSLLDEDRLQSLVDTSLIGKEIKVLKTVDSTNEEIKRLARSGAENGLVVAAECQSAGKGRFSRQWSSGVDGGLYFSVLLRPELPPSDIAAITLAVGYAVCLAIIDYTKLPAQIKWPNDIIIGRKKVCGILTEMAAQSDRVDHLIIGIGINVNNPSFPAELKEKATSLFLESGSRLDRNAFLACVLNHLDTALQNYFLSLSIDGIEDFKSLCATLERQVTVQRSGQQITGTAFDVSPSGELLIRTAEGQEIAVNSGEVTVQGIY